jgi:hypothetical protein
LPVPIQAGEQPNNSRVFLFGDNMKHSICGFNHAALCITFKCDYIDAQILRCLIEFSGTGKMKTLRVDGKEYFWVSHTWLLDELPFSGMNSAKVVGRRLLKYVENGLMEKYVESGNRTYYKFIDESRYQLLNLPLMEPPVLQSPTPGTSKSHPPVLQSPTIDPNTNIQENNNQIKEIVPEYRKCSDILKKRVLETRQQKITEETLIKWDNTVRLMVQRDERTIEDIKKIINECHDMTPRPNGFTWRDNILSMDSLRLRWNEGKVYIGMNNNGKQHIDIPPGGSRII